MKAILLLASMLFSSCYTSHTTYSRGVLTRTVAFGPAASIRIDGAKVEATTVRSPGAAMAGGAFVGSAVGSFLRSAF
ncbi:hypothetical protein EBZ39_03160 [bacterium]|nr:hypothetical protein [bacterium]